MRVSLRQLVSHHKAQHEHHHIETEIDWPDGLPLPSRDDLVHLGEMTAQVDAVEFFVGETPSVGLVLSEPDPVRGPVTLEEWVAEHRPGWTLH